MRHYITIKHTALACLVALSAASCNDWLTLYPQDRVVEEDFWEDKNDLDGVRYAAYKQMSTTLFNLITWGDLRADCYRINSVNNTTDQNQTTRTNFIKALAAQCDSTMDFYDWGSVYTTINYCNKVLAHGEEVLERDAQFTTTEWKEIRAEMTALRALNYFYLIRAFKDIPYSTRVINSDEEVMTFELTSGMNVLDTLISDVRSVAGQARNRFTSNADTKGMITNTAVYALLAEMYLWRSALRQGRGYEVEEWTADCDSVIYYGQLSLDALANQNELATVGGSMSEDNSVKSYFGDASISLQNASLISNEDVEAEWTAKRDSRFDVPSFSAIFTSGNSRESIFELQYSVSDERKNDTPSSFYGNNNNGNGNNSYLMVSNDAVLSVYNKVEADFYKDTRTWYSCNCRIEGVTTDGSYNCFKWHSVDFYNNTNQRIRVSTVQSSYRNWILYRQTDVMLMMAEAYAARANITANQQNNPDLRMARAICDAIHWRSSAEQSDYTKARTYVASPHNTANYLKMVMAERQIELLGEGKRWFDLVRYAERIGGGVNPDEREPQYTDGQTGVNDMIHDFLAVTQPTMEQTLKNRIKNRYGLYCPIYYMELKANDYKIPQNPVWNREKNGVADVADTSSETAE